MTSTREQSEEETEPLEAPQSLVGRTLGGDYRLARMINLGGMGAIFRAEQLSTDRRVAVKVLKPSKSDDADLVRRFDREIDVLTRLSHPNIVTLIDAGRDAGGISYVVMEYVEGATFGDVLENGSLTLLEIVDVFIETASALAEAHDADVVHRDLKLENLMVSRQADGRLRVTVLDFGVAKPLESRENFELTRKNQVPGTPSIVAPELVEHCRPSPRSDLYSFGVMLYTALAGEPPFRAMNDLELMRAHKSQPVPDLRGRAATYVPEPLIDLTECLLEKDPEERPGSASAVRRKLEAIRRELWEMPIQRYTYRPGDNGPPDLRGETAPHDEEDTARERSDSDSWVGAVFGDDE